MAKKIKHVFGNRIELLFPLNERIVNVISGGVSSSDTPIQVPGFFVRFSKGYGSVTHDVNVTLQDNMLKMVDNGTIPIGTWSIEIAGTLNNTPLRYSRDAFLEVVDATDDGGDYANDEVDVIAYYPVINGRNSAVIITEDEVILQVGSHIATDDDGDDEATINDEYGAGSITETDDEIIINI